MEKKYWHKLTNEEVAKVIKKYPLIKNIKKHYKQPDWCDDSNAIHPLGCWSLIGDNRKSISIKYCKSCDLFKKVKRHGKEEG